MHTNYSQRIGKRFREEIIVFKKPKKPKINGNAQPKPKFLTPFTFCLTHLQSSEIIQQGRKHKQEQKPPIPAGIEIIASHQQQFVLILKATLPNKPIQ